jgi:cytochrome P450
LLYLKSILGKLPLNAHADLAFGDIAREHFPSGGLYYLDLWPVSDLFLINVSPNVSNQMHANPAISMEKHELLDRFFKPICGGPSLFDLREKDWKPWRVIFSRGFSPDYVLSLVPHMVDETVVYCDALKSLASKGEMFCLDLKTRRFTMDLIGKTILYAEQLASPLLPSPSFFFFPTH